MRGGKEVPFGAVSPNESTHDYAYMLRRTAGANYKVVSGYNGTTEIGLAMERGEVVGSCGWDWASVKAQRGDWLRDKKLNVLLQIGLERNDELTKMGVPHVWDYVKDDTNRKVVELVIGQQVFQRSYIAPPEIPAAPLSILRSAFDATMTDPQFLADADKLRIDIAPLPGAKVQEIVQKLHATPKNIVQAARAAIRALRQGVFDAGTMAQVGLLIAAAGIALAPPARRRPGFLRRQDHRLHRRPLCRRRLRHLCARASARHLARHIPGNPAIVMRNMPGAGSAKAGLHITHTAAKDGTVIGAVTPGAIMSALLDGRSDSTFDPTRVNFIGTANHGTRICVTMKEAGGADFRGHAQDQDRHRRRRRQRRHARLRLHGEERHRRAAFNRRRLQRHAPTSGSRWSAGEVDGSCGWDWASFKSQRADWLKENRVNVLTQIGHDPDEELTRRGAPPIWNFIKNEDDRKAVELIISQQVFHRSYIAPPGVPAPQLAILRTAFMATMKDPQFLADAEKTGIDIAPLDGGKIQDLIARLAADAGRGGAARQARDPAVRGH